MAVAILLFLLIAFVVGGVAGVALLRNATKQGAPAFGGAAPGLGDSRKMDPFAVGEPWRQFVTRATRARTQFATAISTVGPGPKLDRLNSIGVRLDEAVDDVWSVARQGHALSQGRNRIDLGEIRRRLGTVSGDDATSASTRESLQNQIDAAERLNSEISQTERTLELLTTRLDESVATATELSAGASSSADLGAIGSLDSDMNRLVDDLEALRLALAETEAADALLALPSDSIFDDDSRPSGSADGTPSTG